MKKKIGITCTGADERTDLDLLATFDCEVGILVKLPKIGSRGSNRFPSIEWIEHAVQQLPRVALHFCGEEAKTALFHSSLFDRFVGAADRIQINGEVNEQYIAQCCDMHPEMKWITQWNERNEPKAFGTHSNHELLVDSSGGKGILPGEWKRPCTFKRVGFAGGLNRAQLKSEFRRIVAIGQGDFWIDAERWLRKDDWFDLDEVCRFIDTFQGCCVEHRLEWE